MTRSHKKQIPITPLLNIDQPITKMHESDICPLVTNNEEYNGFFIGGGGTKGIYALGVLKYLFEKNPYIDLNTAKIIGGTSVGSYFAAALSLGTKKDDVIEISKKINLDNLIDNKYLFFVTACRFLSYGYLYSNDGRIEIIKTILDHKFDVIKSHLNLSNDKSFQSTDLTFGQLKKLIDQYPNIYKHLVINTVDISRSTQLFMTTLDDKCDNIKIFTALMASSSIPYIFKPVTMYYDSHNDIYNNDEIVGSTINTLVDGGVCTNNPLDYFLLHDKKFKDYKLWLLKFSCTPDYVRIGNDKTLIEQLIEYLLSGKNDIKATMIEREYFISIINLHVTAGTLDIYTQKQIQNIFNEIYEECKKGILRFDD